MTRPTELLRHEIAEQTRAMPDDILLALVAHHVQPRRGRRLTRGLAELEALAELLASEKRRADAAEVERDTRTRVAAEAERAVVVFTNRAEAAEKLAADWKASEDAACVSAVESQERADQLETELEATRQARDKAYRDLADSRTARSLDQQAIDAVNDRVKRGERALAELEKLKGQRSGSSSSRHARAWKACAREMRDRWLFARRQVPGPVKVAPTALPPTPFEAREREKIRTGFYEQDRPDLEGTTDADLDEDLPTPPPEREPRLNTGGPLFGEGRKAKR